MPCHREAPSFSIYVLLCYDSSWSRVFNLCLKSVLCLSLEIASFLLLFCLWRSKASTEGQSVLMCSCPRGAAIYSLDAKLLVIPVLKRRLGKVQAEIRWTKCCVLQAGKLCAPTGRDSTEACLCHGEQPGWEVPSTQTESVRPGWAGPAPCPRLRVTWCVHDFGSHLPAKKNINYVKSWNRKCLSICTILVQWLLTFCYKVYLRLCLIFNSTVWK